MGTSTIVAIFLGQETTGELRLYPEPGGAGESHCDHGGVAEPGRRCFWNTRYHGVCKTLYPVHSALPGVLSFLIPLKYW